MGCTCILTGIRKLGTAIGVTVTTVVFDAVRSKNGPEADELPSYQAAQWAAFAFGVIGLSILVQCTPPWH